jgi:hypothetical protein
MITLWIVMGDRTAAVLRASPLSSTTHPQQYTVSSEI